LALLEIPVHLVPTIRARKSFVNLALRRRSLRAQPLRLTKAVWAAMGLVGEASEVVPRTETGLVVANMFSAAFFGWTCKVTYRGLYDYFVTRAKTTLPGVPSSFGGLSGGGLWQITFTLKKATGTWGWRLHFCGVIFFEEPQPPNVIAIRCHGPKSVFQTAWKAWGLRERRPAAHRRRAASSVRSRRRSRSR